MSRTVDAAKGQIIEHCIPIRIDPFGNPSGLDMAARYAGSIHKRNLSIAFLASLPFPIVCLNGVDIVWCRCSIVLSLVDGRGVEG